MAFRMKGMNFGSGTGSAMKKSTYKEALKKDPKLNEYIKTRNKLRDIGDTSSPTYTTAQDKINIAYDDPTRHSKAIDPYAPSMPDIILKPKPDKKQITPEPKTVIKPTQIPPEPKTVIKPTILEKEIGSFKPTKKPERVRDPAKVSMWSGKGKGATQLPWYDWHNPDDTVKDEYGPGSPGYRKSPRPKEDDERWKWENITADFDDKQKQLYYPMVDWEKEDARRQAITDANKPDKFGFITAHDKPGVKSFRPATNGSPALYIYTDDEAGRIAQRRIERTQYGKS